jgi:hypothetical protein
MLKSLCVSIIFVLNFTLGVSQLKAQGKPPSWDTIPVKGKCTVIGVLVKDSLSLVYSTTVKTLVNSGYIIEHSDPAAGVVTTGGKYVNRMNLRLSISITATDSGQFLQIHPTGQLEISGYADNTWSQVKYAGQKGSALMDCWKETDRFARSLPGAVYYYNDPSIR